MTQILCQVSNFTLDIIAGHHLVVLLLSIYLQKVKKICFLFQAALCADYSVPVDCVTAGPAPRPSSFHEISAPKVSALVMVTRSVNCQSGKCTSRTRLTFKDNVKLHKILALAHSDVGSRY